MNRTPQELRAFFEQEGIDFDDCVRAFGEGEGNNPYVRAVMGMAEEGDLEFDDVTVVSEGGDHGAYVLGWKWVSFEEADIGSASLEAMCKALDAHLSFGAENTGQWPLLAKLEWLQETLSNFAEELDDIGNDDPIHDVSQAICWTTDFGTFTFTPSTAIADLLAEARASQQLHEADAKAVEIYLDEFGDKLDRMLTTYSLERAA